MVWRLAVCLVATKGVAVLDDIAAVPSAEIRALLGIGKSNVARLRRSLIEALAVEDRDPYRRSEERARRDAWVLGRRLARGDEVEEPKESATPIVRVPEVSWQAGLAQTEAELLAGRSSTSDHLASTRSFSEVTMLPKAGWMRLVEYCGYSPAASIPVDGLVLPCLAVLEDVDGVRALIHSGDIPIRVWARALPAGVAYLIEVRGEGDVVAVLTMDFIANRLEAETAFRTEAGTEYRFNHLPTYRDLVLAACHPERSRA